jgi:hypothetical protein
MAPEIKIGSKVRTLSGDVDYRKHAGAVGIVTAFSRFSPYHGREVSLKTEDGTCLGYFWLSLVELADNAVSS